MRDPTVTYIPPEVIADPSSPPIHGDFKPVRDLEISDLPQGWRCQEGLDVLCQVSQRVVMIYIPRMSSERPTSIFSACPHFGGTGFAYYVDRDVVKVRTNLHVIYNAEEASSATVQFSLQIPGKRHTRTIRLRASAHHFYNNLWEDYSSFTCFTTKRLMKYLYVFRDVPVLWDSSFFTNEIWSGGMTNGEDFVVDPLHRQTEGHNLSVSRCSKDSNPKHSPGYDTWSSGDGGWLGDDEEVSENDDDQFGTSKSIDDEGDLDQSRVSSIGIAGMQTAEYCLDYNDVGAVDAVDNAYTCKADSRQNPKPSLENGDYVAILSHPQGSEKCFSIGPAALYDTETLTKQTDYFKKRRKGLHTARQTQAGQSTVHLINDRFRICQNRIYHTQSTFGCSGSPILLFKRSLQRLKIPVVDYSQHSGTCFFRNGDKLGFATCFTPSVFSQSVRPDDDLHQCYSVIRKQEQIERNEEKCFSKKFGLQDVGSESTHIFNTERAPANLGCYYSVDNGNIIRSSLSDGNVSKQVVPPANSSLQKLFHTKNLLPSSEQQTGLCSMLADREQEECGMNDNCYLGSSLRKQRYKSINCNVSNSFTDLTDLENLRIDDNKVGCEQATPSCSNWKDQGSENLSLREKYDIGKNLYILEGGGGYRILRKKRRSFGHYLTRKYTHRLEEQQLLREEEWCIKKQTKKLQNSALYPSCLHQSSPSTELDIFENDSPRQRYLTSSHTTSERLKNCGSTSGQFSDEDSVGASASENCSAFCYESEKASEDLGIPVSKSGNDIKSDNQTEKSTYSLKHPEWPVTSAEDLGIPVSKSGNDIKSVRQTEKSTYSLKHPEWPVTSAEDLGIPVSKSGNDIKSVRQTEKSTYSLKHPEWPVTSAEDLGIPVSKSGNDIKSDSQTEKSTYSLKHPEWSVTSAEDLGIPVSKSGNDIKSDSQTEKSTYSLKHPEWPVTSEALAVSKLLKDMLRINSNDCSADHNHTNTKNSDYPGLLRNCSPIATCYVDQRVVGKAAESQIPDCLYNPEKNCPERNREETETTNCGDSVVDLDYKHTSCPLTIQNADELLDARNDNQSFCKDLMEYGIKFPSVSVTNCEIPSRMQTKLDDQHEEENEGLQSELVPAVEFMNKNEQTIRTASCGFSNVTEPVIKTGYNPGGTVQSTDTRFLSALHQDVCESGMHDWTVCDSIVQNNFCPLDALSQHSAQDANHYYKDDAVEYPDRNNHLASVEREIEEQDQMLWSQVHVMSSSEYESSSSDNLTLLSPIHSCHPLDMLNTLWPHRHAQIPDMDSESQKTQYGNALPVMDRSKNSEATSTDYEEDNSQFPPDECLFPSVDSTQGTERLTPGNLSQTLQPGTSSPGSYQTNLKETEICDNLVLTPTPSSERSTPGNLLQTLQSGDSSPGSCQMDLKELDIYGDLSKPSSDIYAGQGDVKDTSKLSTYSVISPDKCDISLGPDVQCLAADSLPNSEYSTKQLFPPQTKQVEEKRWEHILVAPFPDHFFTERNMKSRFGFGDLLYARQTGKSFDVLFAEQTTRPLDVSCAEQTAKPLHALCVEQTARPLDVSCAEQIAKPLHALCAEQTARPLDVSCAEQSAKPLHALCVEQIARPLDVSCAEQTTKPLHALCVEQIVTPLDLFYAKQAAKSFVVSCAEQSAKSFDVSCAEQSAKSFDVPCAGQSAKPLDVSCAEQTARPLDVSCAEQTARPLDVPCAEQTTRPLDVPCDEQTARPLDVSYAEQTARPLDVPCAEQTARPLDVPCAEQTARPLDVPCAGQSAKPLDVSYTEHTINNGFKSHETSTKDHTQQNMSKEFQVFQASDSANAESEHNQVLSNSRRLILPAPRSAYKLSELKRLKHEWQKRCGKITDELAKPTSEGSTNTDISSSLQEMAKRFSSTERPNINCTQDRANNNFQTDIENYCHEIGKWLENRGKRSMLKDPLSQASKTNLSFSSASRYPTVVASNDTRPVSALRPDTKDANVPIHALPIHCPTQIASLSNDSSRKSHSRQTLETRHPFSRERLGQCNEVIHHVHRLNIQPTLDAKTSNILSSQTNTLFDPAIVHQQPYHAPVPGNIHHHAGRPVVKTYPDMISGRSADLSLQHSSQPAMNGSNVGQQYDVLPSSRLYMPTHDFRQKALPTGTETSTQCSQNSFLPSIWAPGSDCETKFETDKSNSSSKFLNLDGRDFGYYRPFVWPKHAKISSNTEHCFNQKYTTADYANFTQTSSQPSVSANPFQFGAVGSGLTSRNVGFARQNYFGKKVQEPTGSNTTGIARARATPQNYFPVRNRFSTEIPAQRHGYHPALQNTQSHTEPYLTACHRPSLSGHDHTQSCYSAYAGQHYPFPPQSFSKTQIRPERAVANCNPSSLSVPFIMNRGTENSGDVLRPSHSNLTSAVHFQPESASYDSSLGSRSVVLSSTDNSSFYSCPEMSLSEVNTLPKVSECCAPDTKLPKLYNLWGSSYRTANAHLAGAQVNDTYNNVTERKTDPEYKWDNTADKPCKTETKPDVNTFSILKQEKIKVTVPSLSQAFDKFLSADADDITDKYPLDNLADTKRFWEGEQSDSHQVQKPSSWSISSCESGQQLGPMQEQPWIDHRAEMPNLYQSATWNQPERSMFSDKTAYNSHRVGSTSESSKRLVGLGCADASKLNLSSAFERFLNAAPYDGIETSVANCYTPALVDQDGLRTSEPSERCDQQQESNGYDIDSVVRVVLEMGRFYPKNLSVSTASGSRPNSQCGTPDSFPRKSVCSAHVRKSTRMDSDSVDQRYCSGQADKIHPSGSDSSHYPSYSADKSNPSSESTGKSYPPLDSARKRHLSDSADKRHPFPNSSNKKHNFSSSDSSCRKHNSDSPSKKHCPIRTIRTRTLSKVRDCLFQHVHCSKKKFMQKQVQISDSVQNNPEQGCGLDNNDYNFLVKSDLCHHTNRSHCRQPEFVSDHETLSAGASAHNLKRTSPAFTWASTINQEVCQNSGPANTHDDHHADVKRKIHSLHLKPSCLHERRPSYPHNLASAHATAGDLHLPPDECVKQYLQLVDNSQHCCHLLPMSFGLPLNNNVPCPFSSSLYHTHTPILQSPPGFPKPFLQQSCHSCVSKHCLGCSHSNSNLPAALEFFQPEMHQNWVQVNFHSSSQDTSEWCTHETDNNCWLDHTESSNNGAFRYLPLVATFDVLDMEFIGTLKDLDIVQLLHSDKEEDKQENLARNDAPKPSDGTAQLSENGGSETGSRRRMYIKNRKIKRGSKSKRYTKGRKEEKFSDTKCGRKQSSDRRFLRSGSSNPQQSEDDIESERVRIDTSLSGNRERKVTRVHETKQTDSLSGSEASDREVCYVTVPVDIRVRLEKAAKWISTQLFGCPGVHYLTATDACTFSIQQNLPLTLQILDLNG